MISSVRPLTLDDAEQLRKLPYVDAVTPSVQGSVKVDTGTRQRDTRRVADAARGAGDKRDAAGERLRHCSARFGEQR